MCGCYFTGSVNVRTHCKPHVVNRASRFHRSAGIDEFDHTVGRRSPVLSTSPSSSGNIFIHTMGLVRLKHYYNDLLFVQLQSCINMFNVLCMM